MNAAANTFEVPSHLEIDVRRPNGVVETVIHPQYKQWAPKDFAAFCVAMKKAGKGEGVAYRNVTKLATYTMSAADKADAASEGVQRYLDKTA
jgi:hypothetical protein